MGTISDKLMRIINTKEDIRQALISKGYDVPTSIPFKEYAKMILDLPCKVDSFPDIEGIVARYSASGLTNEQMAANPVWVDKTGNGYDLQLKNFSWKGMSGVGGYGDENYQTFYKFTLDDYVFIATPPGVKHMNFTFRVTGLQPGNKLTLAFFGTTNTVYGTWNKDGIYTVDADIVEAGKPTYFYNGYGATRGEFTIEILPLYPGFILGDGVDDFAVTEKELNFEDTYTVYTAFIPLQNDPIKNMIVCGKDYKKDFYINYGTQLVFYTANSTKSIPLHINQFTVLLCKRDKTTGVIKNLVTGESFQFSVSQLISNPGLYYLWRSATVFSYGKTAIAGQTICNGYFSTDEDDEKVLDWYKKQYPWLFPYQAWTVVGKTNEDEDRATIANITGNGNDLVLPNVAFSENSGYGSYPFGMNVWNPDYIADQPYGTVHYPNDSKSYATTVKNNATNFRIKFRLRGLPEGGYFLIRVFDMNDLNTVLKTYTYTENGIHEFVYNDPNKPARIILYNGNTPSNVSEFYLDIIPEYEGYLVTDGVDDEVRSAAFTLNKDWTIVGDWELLSNVQINCGIVKAQNVYLYNTANGLLISINNPRSLQSFGTKSLHAICSDGRLYDRNWVEYEYTVDQNFEIVESSLNIGFNLNNYTQIAFKNLGIYNNQILSKDDCIKAYNYLQTLKSK